MPRYIKEKWNANKVRRLTRYRLGNEIKEGRYWITEEERKCRLYQEEEETWEHIWQVCGRSEEEKGGWQGNVRRILEDEGQEEGWLRKLDRKRNRGQEGAAGTDEHVS